MTWRRTQSEAGFVYKYQPPWIELWLFLQEDAALECYILAVLLVGDRCLFLCVQPSVRIALDMVDDATLRPLSFSQSAMRSMRRASGCCCACARNQSRSTCRG